MKHVYGWSISGHVRAYVLVPPTLCALRTSFKTGYKHCVGSARFSTLPTQHKHICFVVSAYIEFGDNRVHLTNVILNSIHSFQWNFPYWFINQIIFTSNNVMYLPIKKTFSFHSGLFRNSMLSHTSGHTKHFQCDIWWRLSTSLNHITLFEKSMNVQIRRFIMTKSISGSNIIQIWLLLISAIWTCIINIHLYPFAWKSLFFRKILFVFLLLQQHIWLASESFKKKFRLKAQSSK